MTLLYKDSIRTNDTSKTRKDKRALPVIIKLRIIKNELSSQDIQALVNQDLALKDTTTYVASGVEGLMK